MVWLIVLLALACACDIRHQRVPNWLSLSVVAVCLALLLNREHDLSLLIIAKSLGITLVLTIPGYARGAFGAADIKLLLGLALLLTYTQMAWLLVTAFSIFCVYWWLFCRRKTCAPFVPAIFSAFCVHLTMI